MHDQEKRTAAGYPIGRGYGHDYMRGGEVFGGYGYRDRPEYAQRRGDADEAAATSPEPEQELSP